MNRIFHARIAAGQYLFLLITTAITIHEMWMKHAIMTILFMLLLIRHEILRDQYLCGQ